GRGSGGSDLRFSRWVWFRYCLFHIVRYLGTDSREALSKDIYLGTDSRKALPKDIYLGTDSRKALPKDIYLGTGSTARL
ncbi:MAG: hypothetical protein WCI05_15030, partial [Myxococcales bacterium]